MAAGPIYVPPLTEEVLKLDSMPGAVGIWWGWWGGDGEGARLGKPRWDSEVPAPAWVRVLEQITFGGVPAWAGGEPRHVLANTPPPLPRGCGVCPGGVGGSKAGARRVERCQGEAANLIAELKGSAPMAPSDVWESVFPSPACSRPSRSATGETRPGSRSLGSPVPGGSALPPLSLSPNISPSLRRETRLCVMGAGLRCPGRFGSSAASPKTSLLAAEPAAFITPPLCRC